MTKSTGWSLTQEVFDYFELPFSIYDYFNASQSDDHVLYENYRQQLNKVLRDCPKPLLLKRNYWATPGWLKENAEKVIRNG